MDRSVQGLKLFYDEEMKRKDISPETAKSRRNAVLKVISHIPEWQKKDLSQIDAEKVAAEFGEKYKDSFKDPSTIYTYQKRFKLGLQNFLTAMETRQENGKELTEKAYSRENNTAQGVIDITIRLDNGRAKFECNRKITQSEAEEIFQLIKGRIEGE